jgi:HAD superfamily hydrolase (TIGR01509 family)
MNLAPVGVRKPRFTAPVGPDRGDQLRPWRRSACATLPPVTRIGAIIFDLDGTLLDTEPLLDRANAEVLHRYGRALTSELRVRLLGRSRADTDRLLAEAAGAAVDPREVGAARAAILDGNWSRAGLMPGAARLVARLAASGTPMAIATSSTSAAVAEKLRSHEAIRAAMAVIVCADHPAVRRPKPAPDIFVVAAAGLGVAPEACLVLEDAPSGVLAALAAGMHVVAVPAPSVRDDPAFSGAARVIGSLDELDPSGWS